jgi:glycosyltransferase involved in cell wall biosynthesis
MTNKFSISVIVPVSERADDVVNLYREYRGRVERLSTEFEFIYVLDGPFPDLADTLRKLRMDDEPIVIVQLAKWFGESTAITAGLDLAKGDVVLTLPAYYQVESSVIPSLIDALTESDVAVAARNRSNDSLFRRVQGWVFNRLVSWLTSQRFRDLGCGARALRRVVISDLNLYGDQHRFLPILVSQLGYRVVEVDAQQDMRDVGTRIYGPGVYIRRLLDILTVFFIAKFTKKPLRFFGLIGSVIAGFGSLVVLVLVIQRLLGDVGLAERPALILGSLLVVLGIQLFAIGLIGELIIFTHARQMKEYQVEETINIVDNEAA